MDGGIENLPAKALKVVILNEGKVMAIDFAGPFTEEGYADFYIQVIDFLKSVGFIRPIDAANKELGYNNREEEKQFDELITRMWGKAGGTE